MNKPQGEDRLATYRAKRDFTATSEPSEGGTSSEHARVFVIQKHWATRLHYDLRLELDGTMRSWAVPKGPSYDPKDKRMAVQVEDHPIAYNQFEGEIPKGQYGAGTVIIWDEGTWTPVGDPHEGFEQGHLKFDLEGVKLKGRWALVRMKNADGNKPTWLLVKDRDAHAQPADVFNVVEALPDSVVPLRSARPMKKPASSGKLRKTAKKVTEKAMAKTATNAASKTASKAKSKTTTKAMSKSATKAASKTATKGASKAATKATPKSATKAASKTASKAASKAATKPASKGATKAASGKTAPARARTRELPGNVIKALPETLAPQLATLAERPPANPKEWLYEIKFDGYRLTARLEGDDVKLYTRNGHDWTARVPHLAQALSGLELGMSWLDGEIVVMDKNGAPDFGSLQNAFDSEQTGDILYFVFDAPIIAGRDMRAEPLVTRREYLKQAITALDSDVIRFSESFEVAPHELVESACKMGLEGVIAKRMDAPYVSRRSATWIKLKCTRRQEFVVVGYTRPKGSRSGLGALLLAVHDDDGALRYVGNVGSGFNEATLDSVSRQLGKLAQDEPALKVPRDAARGAIWVDATMVVEVSFSDWTSAGRIRHGVFRGVRADKPATAIVEETPSDPDEPDSRKAPSRKSAARKAAASSAGGSAKTSSAKAGDSKASDAKATDAMASSARASSARARNARASNASKSDNAPKTGSANKAASGRLTNPERVIDESTGLTKLDLAQYYADAGALLLPHLAARPVSFLRAPQGVTGQMFFQKHLEHDMPGVRDLPQSLDPDHPSLVEVPTMQAILSAAQMNVVEFHTWNAVKTDISRPDRMTFDLDPGEGVPWKNVQGAAQLLRAMLKELSLEGWLKTSGGKGLHVVVPLRRQHDWDRVKSLSQSIVVHLAKTIPKIFVSKSGPKNRVGKVFVDYLRNGFGATTVAAWSARARPGLGVSVPVEWDELDDIRSGAQWNIVNIQDRLSVGNQPWKKARAQSLKDALAWADDR